MPEHVPTTDEVRERFIDGAINLAAAEGATGFSVTRYIIDKAREDFDRWLAEVKAEALREAAAAVGTYDEGDVHLWARDADTWLMDRADRIEKGAHRG